MFTGIVEEIGKVVRAQKEKLTVKCVSVLEGTKIGDSIAVNGVCLTVTELLDDAFVVDVSPETSKVTNLSSLNASNYVNLERAMKADGRFGGHIVAGHVDGLAKIIEIKKSANFYNLKLELDNSLTKYMISKGSVTVNGISLTIASVERTFINIAIIPHTFENTNLMYLKNADFVNVEVDMVAKYIEKFLLSSDNESRISREFLQKNGF